MIETATYIGLVDFSKLINRTVYAPKLRHFGTSAEMSWVRSVLGPKCPYTIDLTWKCCYF